MSHAHYAELGTKSNSDARLDCHPPSAPKRRRQAADLRSRQPSAISRASAAGSVSIG
jgi:hypothetical protein